MPVWVFAVIFLLQCLPTCGSDDSKCSTCKDIVKEVKSGIRKTAKSNFGGGNTKWEEKSLGSYAFSETRLIEILEDVCNAKECHKMLEESEEFIENWWFKHFAKRKDTELHSYLCVERVKVCCPNNTYGPDCKECEGGRERPCRGNGDCDGGGTREGNGKCKCHAGYDGDQCEDCKDGHFEESRNETHTVCTECHVSCKDDCSGPGPTGCDECDSGWTKHEQEGCLDINECEKEDICKDNEYCKNEAGSHSCEVCDASCSGCTGPGQSSCKECDTRYYKNGDECTACHPACDKSCTDDTPKTCDACKYDGWIWSDESGSCEDVNECADEFPCKDAEYCDNTVGSYRCFSCHKACKQCTWHGVDKCTECNAGYELVNETTCQDINECTHEGVCGENQQCANTVGSFNCKCDKGYVLKKDKCVEKQKDAPKNTGSGKKSKKKSSKKKKSKLQNEYLKYFASLVGFGLVGKLLSRSWFAQLVFTCTFWLYLFWFSMKFDKMTKSDFVS